MISSMSFSSMYVYQVPPGYTTMHGPFLAAIEAAAGVDAHAAGPFILSALMR
jgi:hypothetical protein